MEDIVVGSASTSAVSSGVGILSRLSIGNILLLKPLEKHQVYLSCLWHFYLIFFTKIS